MIFDRVMIGTSGSKRVISTSKIRKITAIRKKRKENGIRADPLGSNPHSNGEFFSRSLIIFLDRVDDTNMRIIAKTKVNKIKGDNERIIFPESFRLTDWKSIVLFILERFSYLPHQ